MHGSARRTVRHYHTLLLLPSASMISSRLYGQWESIDGCWLGEMKYWGGGHYRGHFDSLGIHVQGTGCIVLELDETQEIVAKVEPALEVHSGQGEYHGEVQA